jgi:threonylcarbamoyladenosine tRNA methylthiotransferase MtaB
MRIFFETHGCRLNQAETDALERMVIEAGHEVVDREQADVFVLNSCTITHSADADARKRVRSFARNFPDKPVVVTGCYANSSPQEAAALEGVKLVLGNREKDDFVALLNQHLSGESGGELGSSSLSRSNRGFVAVSALMRRRESTSAAVKELPSAPRARRARSFLKIQDGCNYSCSFCIVPQVRGRNRSYEFAQVRANFCEVVDSGRREIVLTGIHLGTFGWDLGRRNGLVEVMRELLPLRGDARIRLGSLDPHEVREPMVELFAEHGGAGLCRHLHLPMQSGSDAVLAAMRRAHRRAELDALVPTLRQRVPGIAIGTDVIVGFPGESDDDFAATLSLFENGSVDYAHVFTYSRREGTRAAARMDQVDDSIKQTRSAKARALNKQTWQSFCAQKIGEEVEVIAIERNADGAWTGLSDHYLDLNLGPGNWRKGQSLGVRIEGESGRVFGRVL